MDDEDDDVPTCPLCLEELDATDRAVKACQCGYQVCLWCLHTIREQLNQRCPACRTPYEEQNFKIVDVNPEEAAKEVRERKTAKKERERREKLKKVERERERALMLSQQKAKSNLQHVRILQRNLVYIIGLSLSLAREEVIRRTDMFGKFGRMLRVLVNRSHPFHADAPGGPSISAYVQYQRDADASTAVRAMNNAVFDGREIRCAIATSKYCEAYVVGVHNTDSSATAIHHCGNANCLYYHTTAQSENVLTREEVLARQLGPPPPAHLFEPAVSRRSGLPSNRLVSPQPSVTQPFASSNRSATSRPLMNIHVSSPHRTTDMNYSLSAPQSLSVSSTMEVSKLPSPPGPSLQTSGVEPVSSSPSYHLLSKNGRSISPSSKLPMNSGNRDGHYEHESRIGLSISSLGPSGGVPSSVVGSCNAMHATTTRLPPQNSIPLSPRRQQVPSMTESVPLEGNSHDVTTQSSRRVEGAPPGFECAEATRPSVSLSSRPPGFEQSSSSSLLLPVKNQLKSTATQPQDRLNISKAQQYEKNGEGAISTPVLPPGFKSYQNPSVPSEEEDMNSLHAAEWLRKAPSDGIFSGSFRVPLPPVGEGGKSGIAYSKEVEKRNGEARGNHAELEQLVTSIGGSPSILCTFQSDFTLGGTAPVEAVPPTPIDVSNISGLRNEAIPHDSVGAYSDKMKILDGLGADSMDGFSSLSSNIAHAHSMNALLTSESMRSAVTAVLRRKDSRFGFARQGELDFIVGDRVESSGDKDLKSFDGLFNDTSGNGNAGCREHGETRNVSRFSDMATSRKATLGRHSRSRFEFADQGLSSLPNVDHGQSTPALISTNNLLDVSFPDEISSNATGDTMSLGQSESLRFRDTTAFFSSMGSCDNLEKIFTSEKWSPRNGVPTAPTNHNSTGRQHIYVSTRSSDASLLQSECSEAKLNDGNAGGLSSSFGCNFQTSVPRCYSEDNPLLKSDRVPEFGAATSGEHVEENLDTKALPAGLIDPATSAIHNDTGDAIARSPSTGSNAPTECRSEDQNLPGGHGEDDRRKSRSQRKRDRKRGGKDPTERKMVKTSIPCDVIGGGTIRSKDDTIKKGTTPNHPPQEPGLTTKSTGNTDFEKSEPGCISDTDSHDELSPDNMVTAPIIGNRTASPLENSLENKPSIFPVAESGVRSIDGSVTAVSTTSSSQGLGCGDENGRHLSVSELEREVEAARAREAQLQDKLMEITRRLRSYDNVRT